MLYCDHILEEVLCLSRKLLNFMFKIQIIIQMDLIYFEYMKKN